jgi:hypothetical protein
MRIVRCSTGLGTAPGSLSRRGLYGESGRGPKDDSLFAVLFLGKNLTALPAGSPWLCRSFRPSDDTARIEFSV